jgi:phycobilisome rod-core linker protein
MALPALQYAPSSQNQRVKGFEVAGDEQPRIFSTDTLLSTLEFDALITGAYRQIFHEQQMLVSNRQPQLESQLKSRQITVKDFIVGLATCDSFRRLNYDANNNYRFVELCVQRILGRQVYNQREKMAWSIVLATRGLNSFIHDLVSTEEYNNNFGDNTVPYQLRRILPQRSQGELPFERMARYGTDYRNKLPKPSSYSLGSWVYAEPADGIFRKFEPFDLDTFIRRANWPVTAGLFLVLFILLIASITVVGSVSAAG